MSWISGHLVLSLKINCDIIINEKIQEEIKFKGGMLFALVVFVCLFACLFLVVCRCSFRSRTPTLV